MDLAAGVEPASQEYEARILPTELSQSGSETENRTRVGGLPNHCSATELSQKEFVLDRRQAAKELKGLTAELVRARAWINGEGSHGFPDGPSFCGLDDRTSITETFARYGWGCGVANFESPLTFDIGCGSWIRTSGRMIMGHSIYQADSIPR